MLWVSSATAPAWRIMYASSLPAGRVQAGIGRASLQHGQQGYAEIHRAPRTDGDPVVGAGAQPGQNAGQRSGAAVQFGIGEGRAVIGDGGRHRPGAACAAQRTRSICAAVTGRCGPLSAGAASPPGCSGNISSMASGLATMLCSRVVRAARPWRHCRRIEQRQVIAERAVQQAIFLHHCQGQVELAIGLWGIPSSAPVHGRPRRLVRGAALW